MNSRIVGTTGDHASIADWEAWVTDSSNFNGGDWDDTVSGNGGDQVVRFQDQQHANTNNSIVCDTLATATYFKVTFRPDTENGVDPVGTTVASAGSIDMDAGTTPSIYSSQNHSAHLLLDGSPDVEWHIDDLCLGYGTSGNRRRSIQFSSSTDFDVYIDRCWLISYPAASGRAYRYGPTGASAGRIYMRSNMIYSDFNARMFTEMSGYYILGNTFAFDDSDDTFAYVASSGVIPSYLYGNAIFEFEGDGSTTTTAWDGTGSDFLTDYNVSNYTGAAWTGDFDGADDIDNSTRAAAFVNTTTDWYPKDAGALDGAVDYDALSAGLKAVWPTHDFLGQLIPTSGTITAGGIQLDAASGSTEADDERSAEVTGQQSDNSARAAETTGSDDTESTRSAEASGQSGAAAQRAAEAHGQDVASATRAAEASGSDAADSSRSAELAGAYAWRIERSVNGSPWTVIEDAIPIEESGGQFTFTDTDGLADGDEYCYRVKNVTDDSAYSNTDCVSYSIGTGASDTRAAEILGEGAANDARSAEATGQEFATTERASEISGQAIDQDTRAAELSGEDSIPSARSAELTGYNTAEEERAAELSGVGTTSAERAAEIAGQEAASDTRAAELSGVDATSDSRTAEATGSQDTSSSRAAELTADAAVSSERGAALEGAGGTASARAAEIHGVDTTSSTRSAEVTGALSAAEERGAELSGIAPSTDERAAEIAGTSESSTERNAELSGAITTDDTRPAELSGAQGDSSTRSAETGGENPDNDDRSAEISGAAGSQAQRAAELTGSAIGTAQRGAKLSGSDSASATRSAEVTGTEAASSTRSAELEGVLAANSERGAAITGDGVWPYCPTPSPYSKKDPYTEKSNPYTRYPRRGC